MTATVQIAEHIQNTSHRIKLAQMQKRVGRSPVTKKKQRKQIVTNIKGIQENFKYNLQGNV